MKAIANLGLSRLLCVTVWFLDELFHNLCDERMTCCLIHAMSEWGPFGSVYWAVLHCCPQYIPALYHAALIGSKHQLKRFRTAMNEPCRVSTLCIYAYMHTWRESAPYGHLNPYPNVIRGICALDWKLEYANLLQDFPFHTSCPHFKQS